MAGRRRKDSKVTESEGTLRGNRLLKPIKHLTCLSDPHATAASL